MSCVVITTQVDLVIPHARRGTHGNVKVVTRPGAEVVETLFTLKNRQLKAIKNQTYKSKNRIFYKVRIQTNLQCMQMKKMFSIQPTKSCI